MRKKELIYAVERWDCSSHFPKETCPCCGEKGHYNLHRAHIIEQVRVTKAHRRYIILNLS